jgi:hypothetical protein
MHKLDSGMVLATRYGGIVLGPRRRTFGVTPAMFAKQNSEHAYNGHCSGRLTGIAVVTVCINWNPECFRSLNMVVSCPFRGREHSA